MNKKLRTILGIIAIIVIGIIAYFLGYKTAYDDFEANTDNEYMSYQSFYATITDITEDNVTVEGMKINDINFRGKFTFATADIAKIEWRYVEKSVSELEVGDNISILFKGIVQETSPARIVGTLKIQLLDDE